MVSKKYNPQYTITRLYFTLYPVSAFLGMFAKYCMKNCACNHTQALQNV